MNVCAFIQLERDCMRSCLSRAYAAELGAGDVSCIGESNSLFSGDPEKFAVEVPCWMLTEADLSQSLSPSAPVRAAVLLACRAEEEEAEKRYLLPSSSLSDLLIVARAHSRNDVSAALAFIDASVASCKGDDALLDARATPALANDTLGSLPAPTCPHATSPLQRSVSVAARVWSAAKATATAVASATASTVAATDFSVFLEAARVPLLAAVGYMNLKSSNRDPICSTKERLREAIALIIGDKAVESGSVAGALNASANGSRAILGTGEADEGRKADHEHDHIFMPLAPRWVCSPSNERCGEQNGISAIADPFSILQGSGPEGADCRAAGGKLLQTYHPPRMDIGEESSLSATKILGGSTGPLGVLPEGAEGLGQAGVHADGTSYTAHDMALGGLHKRENTVSSGKNTNFLSEIGQTSGCGNILEASDSHTECGKSDALRIHSLRLLEARAACAAERFPLSEATVQLPNARSSPVQQNQNKVGEDTGVAVFTRQGMHLELREGDAAQVSSEVATAAQYVTQQPRQTVWSSFQCALSAASRRSIKAVQRAAGAAYTAVVGADTKMDALLAPFFGACGASKRRISADAGDHVALEAASQQQPEDGGSTHVRLLGKLNPHFVAGHLRNRSANLVHHSVALISSPSISEARYHVAELVNTGGPEVSGLWAGIKVGLGIAALASGHLLMGGAMVAAATGSLGTALFWGWHRQEVYDMMRGDFAGRADQEPQES
ncbi:hypothetical protein cyc_01703 [Cyclospora cayetanensis]|uniref:Transmembrane protein n=1 Tax=Cyclospora cayetanensis TaxID=88456 RepID=A0A1D3CS07_9EIME|nr:hypothetical protein cyc_01703 [Cyclospora cayetanensis]